MISILKWLNDIKNPLQRLLFGILVFAVIALWNKNKSDTRDYRSALKEKDSCINAEKLGRLQCEKEKYQDKVNQVERLELRADKNDSARQILKNIQ